ncbi:MAG: sensor histidine kinase [Deltaproteobacteria bacterium]|nr:sensor histidine kinase [Deltaproteobacteria bacterium]
MLELSLHILDVVENGLTAGASLIEIELDKDENLDLLTISVIDNGRGIAIEDLPKVVDPFYTTRTTRNVGLGLPLLKQSAEQTGGSFRIESQVGQGTTLFAQFHLSHLDRAPLGDMQGTLMSLIVGRPDVDFIYRQKNGNDEFILDTREIKEALDGMSMSDPEVINFLRKNIAEGLAELGPI